MTLIKIFYTAIIFLIVSKFVIFTTFNYYDDFYIPKVKVAVMLVGLSRTFTTDRVRNSIYKHVYKPLYDDGYEVHTYACMEDKYDVRIDRKKRYKDSNVRVSSQQMYYYLNNMNKNIDYYTLNPLPIHHECTNNVFQGQGKVNSQQRQLEMFNRIETCLDLISNDFTWIIKLRPDIVLYRNIPSLKLLDLNTTYIPLVHNARLPGVKEKDKFSDNFMIASYKNAQTSLRPITMICNNTNLSNHEKNMLNINEHVFRYISKDVQVEKLKQIRFGIYINTGKSYITRNISEYN